MFDAEESDAEEIDADEGRSLEDKSAFRQVRADTVCPEDVRVDVKNGLTDAVAGVEYEAILTARSLVGKVLGDGHNIGEQLRVSCRELRDVRKLGGLGYDEQVHRGLWRNIREGDDSLVFVDDRGRDFARDDALENGGFGDRHEP